MGLLYNNMHSMDDMKPIFTTLGFVYFLFTIIYCSIAAAQGVAAPAVYDGEWRGTYACSEGVGAASSAKAFSYGITIPVTGRSGQRVVDNADLHESYSFTIGDKSVVRVELTGARKVNPQTFNWLIRAAGYLDGATAKVEGPMYRADGKTLVRAHCAFELTNAALAARLAAAGSAATATRPSVPPAAAFAQPPVTVIPPPVPSPPPPTPARPAARGLPPAPAPAPVAVAPASAASLPAPAVQTQATASTAVAPAQVAAAGARVSGIRLLIEGTRDPQQLNELAELITTADTARRARGTTPGQAEELAGKSANATLAILNSHAALGVRVFLDREHPGLRRDLGGTATLGDGTRATEILLLDATTRVPGRSLVDSAALTLGLQIATNPDEMPEDANAYLVALGTRTKALLDAQNIVLPRPRSGAGMPEISIVRMDWEKLTPSRLDVIGQNFPIIIVFNQQIAPLDGARIANPPQPLHRVEMKHNQASFETLSRDLRGRLETSRFQQIGEIPTGDLAQFERQRMEAHKREIARVRGEMDERIEAIRKAAAANDNLAGSLRIYRKGKAPAKAPDAAFCTTATDDAVAIGGLMQSADFLAWAKMKAGTRVTTLAPTPEALFSAITAENCVIVVDRATNLWTFMQAIGRDGQFAYNVGPVMSMMEAREPYAAARGFESWGQFEVARAIGNVDAEDMRRLKDVGIIDLAGYQAAAARMASQGYDKAPIPAAEQVLRFLADEAAGHKLGQSAIDFRKALDAREAEAQRKIDEEAARARAEHARAYPYVAVLTCGMGQGHINILACFAGSGSSRVDTELRLTTDNHSRMYKVYNLKQAGEERRDGFYIELPEHFHLVAQNSHETLMLGLEVVARDGGKVLFKSQAARFGVVSVSN